MAREYLEVTYRDIAKMLCKAMPLEGDDFRDKVENYIEVIKRMPLEAKKALKVAYIFSARVPREEREDMFQDIALAVLKAKTKDERLAYAIGRCDWRDWWRKYSIRQHYSLDTVVDDDDGGQVPLRELLVGEVEFERKVNGKLDAQKIWSLIPAHIRPLVNKRLIGKALTKQEHNTFGYWLKREGYKLALI